MKLILTDIDDTILKFGDAFQAWAESHRGFMTEGRLRDCCDIEKTLLCDPSAVDELVVSFSTDPAVMGAIQPEEDALAVLPTLYGMGYQFVAISSCVDGPLVTEVRRKNLEEAFGFPWLAVHCVGLLKAKVPFLEGYQRTYWVEDNVKHAIAGAAMGHNTFLLDRAYNRVDHPENVKRIPNWHHVFEAVMRDEAEAKRNG